GSVQADRSGGERVLAAETAALDRRRRTGAARPGARGGELGALPRHRFAGGPAAALRGCQVLRLAGGRRFRYRPGGIAGGRTARARLCPRRCLGDRGGRRDRCLLPAAHGRVASRGHRGHRSAATRSDSDSRARETIRRRPLRPGIAARDRGLLDTRPPVIKFWRWSVSLLLATKKSSTPTPT